MRRESLALLVVGLSLSSIPVWAQASACDVVTTGATPTSADVTAAEEMAIGQMTCPSTINIFGLGVCNAVVVQRVVNAEMGLPCIVGTHSVTVSWSASTAGTYPIQGYNVFRSTTPSNYVQINPVIITAAPLQFLDGAVSNNVTYYYVVQAVDTQGNLSAYSSYATAQIPSS